MRNLSEKSRNKQNNGVISQPAGKVMMETKQTEGNKLYNVYKNKLWLLHQDVLQYNSDILQEKKNKTNSKTYKQ